MTKEREIKSKQKIETLHQEIRNLNLLIEKGMNINMFGQNALHLASMNGHKDIVELLLINGLSIYQQTKNGRKYSNWTFLYESKEIIERLNENGVIKL